MFGSGAKVLCVTRDVTHIEVRLADVVTVAAGTVESKTVEGEAPVATETLAERLGSLLEGLEKLIYPGEERKSVTKKRKSDTETKRKSDTETQKSPTKALGKG